MTTQTFTVASYLADSTNWPYPTGDIIRIVDTSTNLSGLTAGQIAAFGTNNVDLVNASDDLLTWNVAQWQAVPAGLAFDIDDLKIVSDTGTNIAGLSTGDLADLNTYGVSQINPTDGSLTLDAGQYGALGGISIDQSADVTISDSDANIGGLSAAQFGAMAVQGIDHIDANDDTLHLTVDQALGLGTVTLDGTDTVTLADTGANLGALTVDQIAALGAAGVSIIDATDDVLSVTVAQGFAGFNAGMNLTAGDTVTVADTGANISAVSASDMANLGADGFDIIDATDDAYSLTVAQGLAIAGSGVVSTSADVITLADTGGNLGEMSVGDISVLGGYGVDVIDSTTDAVTFNIAQVDAILSGEIGLTAADVVTLSDAGASIDAFTSSTYSSYGSLGVDVIDASDNVAYDTDAASAAIMVADGMTFASEDTVTLRDTGALIAGLSAEDFAALEATGYDKIDATDNALALTVAQFEGLGEIGLTGADTVTIRDSGANLQTLDFASLAGAKVDALDATDNLLTLTVAQLQALGTVALAAGDTVTLADTSANIEALSGAQLLALGGKGVDIIDATDDVLSLSLTQFNNLGSVVLTDADAVTVTATGAQIAALGTSKLAQMNAAHVDVLDATDGAASVSIAQLDAMGSMKFVSDDTITLYDSDANLTAMSTDYIAGLAARGVDTINSSDDLLHLTAAQIAALGTVTLDGHGGTMSGPIHLDSPMGGAGPDYIIESDTGANIAAQSAAVLSGLYNLGVDQIDASDDVLNLTVAKFLALDVYSTEPAGSIHPNAFSPTSIVLTGSDTVTLLDTGTNLAALTADQIGNLQYQQVDFLDSTTDLLNLNVAQFQALGEVGLTSTDVVTIKDTGAHLHTLTGGDVSAMVADGVDRIDATDDAVTFTKSIVDALIAGDVALTSTDTVTLRSGEGSLESLSAGQLATYAAKGIDIIDSNSGYLSLDATQVSAMANTGLQVFSGDDVTLRDTGANVLANLGALFGNLASTGIDHIDLTDDAINITVDQALALGTVGFAGNDLVTILDTSSAIEALTGAQLQALGTGGITGPVHPGIPYYSGTGVDVLDATNDVLTVNVDQVTGAYNGGISFASGDLVTLADVGTQLTGETPGYFLTFLGEMGVDVIDATDNAITFNVDQLQGLWESGIALTAADVVTLGDTGANLANLTAADISTLAATGFDKLDVTDDTISLKLNQFSAFANGGFTFGAEDTVTVQASNGDNVMTGHAEHDVFFGKGGNDILDGGAGADTLVGGAGSDMLTGGGGKDVFMFTNISDSTVGSADRIMDLTNADRIDLSGIDANTGVGGNQAFTVVDHFTHTAGELMIKYSAGADQTVIKLDVDGDGVADGQIVIAGDHHDFTNFVL